MAERLVLGYHAARSFWRLVDLEDCRLLPEPVMRLARDVRAWAETTGLPAYHPRTHEGFFRYLLVRSSQATGRMLACLITTPGHEEAVAGLPQALAVRHPALDGLYWGVSRRLADVAQPEELRRLTGAEHLEDRIGPVHLKLAPTSFLQPSSVQAERIYAQVAHSLSQVAGGVAWDLYCGVGLVALYLAGQFRKVYGIDIEPQHLELGRLNAALNGVANVEFRAGAVEQLLRDRRFWLTEARPDAVVLDPPRAGLHPAALSAVLAARPRLIAYLSCNADTLARDLRVLLASFPPYRVTEAYAYDMFPQTNHVETLVILERS
jgi:23S rRNA (uracil1939-C5)-methyltransferase